MLEEKRLINLVAKKSQPLVQDYLSYLHLGWKDFLQPLEPEVLRHKIDLLEKAIRRDCRLSDNLLSRLQKSFVEENLSLYLLLDVLIGWRYLASGKMPTSETQVSDVVSAIISPLSRLLMVLNDENPSTYLPFSSLLVLLFYLELFEGKSAFLQKAKWSRRRRIAKLEGLLKSSGVILSIVRSKRLKFKLAILLNVATSYVKHYQNNEQLTITKLDYISIILYSLWQFISVRKRTITKKGI